MIELYYIEQAQKRRKKILLIILILFFYFLFYTSGLSIAKIGKNSQPNKALTSSINKNIINVTETNKNWNSIENLDIFGNSDFVNNKIIAPETLGIYTFQVENVFKRSILCTIKINETNKYNINIKCKLKKENAYILGNENTWIDIEDISIDSVATANNKSNYTLEWYWESSNNDTEIGKLANIEYKLNINIDAKQI